MLYSDNEIGPREACLFMWMGNNNCDTWLSESNKPLNNVASTISFVKNKLYMWVCLHMGNGDASDC